MMRFKVSHGPKPYNKLIKKIVEKTTTTQLQLVSNLNTDMCPWNPPSMAFAVKWHRRLKDVLTASPLFFFFLVYPSVSQIVLEALRCDDLGPDGKFLATDYRVDCNADKHDTYTKVAYGAIAAVLRA